MKPDSKPSPVDEPVVLAVTGMTCAACAARIEKKLNRIDGVTATVNYATSKATLHVDSPLVAVDDLVSTVEVMGYGAVPPAVDADGRTISTSEIANDSHLVDLRRRLAVAAVGAVPVMAMSNCVLFDPVTGVTAGTAQPPEVPPRAKSAAVTDAGSSGRLTVSRYVPVVV